MLSLIEVECPHCGARGQIVVPPVGSIIIGPCPQCKELVVVFCGQVLALEKEIMESGSREDRQDHILEVLMEFLRDRVDKLMTDQEALEAHALEEGEASAVAEDESADLAEASEPAEGSGNASGDISQSEFDRFVEVDLKLLDNDAYFKSVFNDS